LLASLSYFVVQACAVVIPNATTSRLDGLHRWIDDHRERTLIVLYTVIGRLIGKSTYLMVDRPADGVNTLEPGRILPTVAVAIDHLRKLGRPPDDPARRVSSLIRRRFLVGC
jgi:hypothetical protein